MKMKVVFEDVKFLRATSLQKNQDILVTIAIHRGEKEKMKIKEIQLNFFDFSFWTI